MARVRPPAKPMCRALNNQGGKCGNKAIPGGLVCRSHGGAAPQVANRAAVVAEVLSWGLGQAHADPGEVLLRLVTQCCAPGRCRTPQPCTPSSKSTASKRR